MHYKMQAFKKVTDNIVMSVGKQQIHGSLLPWHPLGRPHPALKLAAGLKKKLMTVSLVSLNTKSVLFQSLTTNLQVKRIIKPT